MTAKNYVFLILREYIKIDEPHTVSKLNLETNEIWKSIITDT